MKIRYTIMEGDRQREKNLIRANDLKSPKRQVRYISVSVCVGGGVWRDIGKKPPIDLEITIRNQMCAPKK